MNDEKDRLGEKLRQKQKAEEDRYFADQDRRNLERLRADAAAASPACPRDATPLAKREHLGVIVDACPSCGGLWLDKGELEAVLRHDEAWATRWLRALLKPSV
jgi:hypothetical protein